MEDTRRDIRQGRALAAKGLYERAKMMWKATLSAAYSMQDYAGMFVLSVNIGEACIWIATQSNTTSLALLQLQEAKENLEYALQLVENCFLWNSVAGYKDLYQGVQRAETLRRKAKKLRDQLQPIEVKQVTTSEKKVVKVCTTCGLGGGDLVLDENDGCTYCRKCYDEYYATVGKDASIETAEGLGTAQGVDKLGEEKRNGLNVESGLDRRKGDSSADLDVAESSATAEPVEVMRVHIEDKHAEEIDTECSEKVKPIRTRYERVELGSLADFLAGTLEVGDKVEQPSLHQNDIRNDTLVVRAADSVKEEECSREPIATTGGLQEGMYETNPAMSGKGAVREGEMPLLDEEDTAGEVREKCVYSVAQLLELWRLSPCDCPEALLTSPVRDDGRARTHARK